jgi:hypothetical protein
MSVRITCINKSGGYHENRHEAIQWLGWIDESTGERGKSERLVMYDWIKNGGYAYVTDHTGSRVSVIDAVTSWGTKYVRTVADGRETNNLLELREC